MQRFVCLVILGSIFFMSACTESPQSRQFSGYFLANDSGQSHGGFEWAGEYAATMEISGDKGTLALSLSTGLGDPLTKHQFGVSDFAESGGNLSFKVDGWTAVLVLEESDTIWNGRFDGYYSANKSANAAEQMGQLPVGAFFGFQPYYYIELRVKPL